MLLERQIRSCFMIIFAALSIAYPLQDLSAAEEESEEKIETSPEAVGSDQPEDSIPSDQATDSQTVVRSEFAIGVDSSRTARTTKIGGVGLRAGMMIEVATGLGLDGWWQVNQDLQMGLFLGSGIIDLKDKVPEVGSANVKITEADVEAGMALIQARYFLGNSFFLTGGLGQRTVKMDVGVENTLLNEWTRGEVDVTSTVLYLALGNLWTWDSGFFIGADWISASIPLSSSVKSNIQTSVQLSADTREQQIKIEDSGEKFGKKSLFQLAVLNVGYTF